VERSFRTGVELEGMVKISNKLNWNGNVTFSRNKIKKFNEVLYDYGVDYDEYNEIVRTSEYSDISFSPSIIIGSGFSYHPFAHAEITLLTKYVEKQYLDNTSNNKRSIDPYLTNDVRLKYFWTPTFIKEIGLSLLVNNILDEKFESNGYTWGYLGGGSEYRENYYYPQAGRNFMAMLSVKF
jgi:iron complex outermembrane receptor protein